MKKLSSVFLTIIVLLLCAHTSFADSSDLIARYHLNEDTNNTTQDSSGNNLIGQDQNITLIKGKYGNAFDFNSGGSIRIVNNQLLEPARVSVEAWVKNATLPGNFQYVLSKGANGCNQASYALYTGDKGGLQFYISDGITFIASPDSGTEVWDNSWHYVVGTYDGSLVRLYVDGQEVGAGTPTNLPIGYGLPNGNDMYIGKYSGTCVFGFNGQADEVRVWDRALTLPEIKKHFTTNPI